MMNEKRRQASAPGSDQNRFTPEQQTSPSKFPSTDFPRAEHIEITMRDLEAFKAGGEFTTSEFAMFARHFLEGMLPLPTHRMIKASTMAWNKIVLRVRANPHRPSPHSIPSATLTVNQYRSPSHSRAPSPRSPRGPSPSPVTAICKPGRAPLLRVWVPAKSNWMDDAEVVECEREIFRAGVWSHLKRGDVVWNVAIGDFANEGKLLFDGKYLRDLSYVYEPVGHLPSWINMLAFSPSYFHNVISSTNPNPLVFLLLISFAATIRQGLSLCQDKMEITSSQGKHMVKKFVYRTSFKLSQGMIISPMGGGRGPPGEITVVADEWLGMVVIETEGTTEHANFLMNRVQNQNPTPWRILRDRSRPGKLWIRPVLDSEKIA